MLEQGTNRLLLEHLFNTRDIGGIAGKDGKLTVFGRFLRSDAPISIHDDEIKTLLSYPVKTVIDLRSEDEVQKEPNLLSTVPEIEYIHIPIIDFSAENDDAEDMKAMLSKTMGDFYVYMLENKKAAFARIFTVIANAKEGAVFFHCTHGKDRTGIVAGILLSLIGVERERILKNYEISYQLLQPLIAELLEKFPEKMHPYLRSDREYLMKVLDFFDTNYQGNSALYLLEIGITPKEIQRIRARLLEENFEAN